MLVSSGSPTKAFGDGSATILSDYPTTLVTLDALSFEVPSLLVDCFSYVESDGLVEGIFRVSGSVRKIREVSSDFNQYTKWLNSEVKKPSPHDVCGVIKLFLREYTSSPNSIFQPSLTNSLKRLYTTEQRNNSTVSAESFPSTVSVLSTVSTLPSIDENNEAEKRKDLEIPRFIASVAHTLLTKNSARKNEFFLFLLHTLSEILKHQEVTKMTAENLSIIFQPYIFTSSVISDLLTFQEIFSVLIINEKLLLEEYVRNHKVLGDLDEEEADVVSVSSLYSPSKTSSTDYSSHQASPSNKPISGSLDAAGRFSLSQKFNSIWDNYNMPFSRPKRFSFTSRGSAKSTEDLDQCQSPGSMHDSDRSLESMYNEFSTPKTITKEAGLKFPTQQNLILQTLDTDSSSSYGRSRRGSTREKRRLSIFGHIRSASPSSHKVDAARRSSVAHLAPDNLLANKGKSADDLLLNGNYNELSPERKSLMSRRLSLWIKKS